MVAATIGYTGALATPRRNRTTVSETIAPAADAAISAGENPVRKVSRPQVTAMSASARRGPYHWPKSPPGICSSAYAKLKLPRIQPSSALLKPNSSRMLGSATDRLLRSR